MHSSKPSLKPNIEEEALKLLELLPHDEQMKVLDYILSLSDNDEQPPNHSDTGVPSEVR